MISFICAAAVRIIRGLVFCWEDCTGGVQPFSLLVKKACIDICVFVRGTEKMHYDSDFKIIKRFSDTLLFLNKCGEMFQFLFLDLFYPSFS